MSATKRLKIARKRRHQTATFFRRLHDGQITLQSSLEDPPRCLNNVSVYDLLRRAPHLNRKGAEKVLKETKIWPITTVGQLSEDDRMRILTHLPPRVR